MASTVEDRLVARRAHLQQYCAVEPVNQHLRLVSYYQLARQLYRQTESYVHTGAWDNAYVFMAKFIKLCSRVIPEHRDYAKPMYHKEREWISEQAQSALPLFDTILNGMEQMEREEAEYERELELAERRRSAVPPPSTPVAAMSLEDRLAAMRLKQSATTAEPGYRSTSTTPRRSAAAAAGMSASYSAGMNHRSIAMAPREPRMTQSSVVSYPTVGKASWMRDTASHHSEPLPVRGLTARQRSQDALEQVSRIRVLEIPASIITIFTSIAEPNTNRYPDGIETCGILAGILQGTRLIITTLIIPKQEGTSDMCSMKNDEELFDYCDGHDLLTLGWIHTHPRQTCFLSSVDIHTQCGFQSILPESVAIVVAPTDRERNVGVFRLSEPDGMQLIQNCRLTGFHTHPNHIQIYSDAVACDWDAHATPEIVDMR